MVIIQPAQPPPAAATEQLPSPLPRTDKLYAEITMRSSIETLLADTQTSRKGHICHASYLTLKSTPGLNLEILPPWIYKSSPNVLNVRTLQHSGLCLVVWFEFCLCDKSRLPSYRDVPIVKLHHVSSSIRQHAGYNVTFSLFHRYDKDNDVLECARLLKHFAVIDYNLSLLFCKLSYHLLACHLQFPYICCVCCGILFVLAWPTSGVHIVHAQWRYTTCVLRADPAVGVDDDEWQLLLFGPII